MGQGSIEKVNIAEKFSKVHEYWVPYIVGELNDSYVKVDKLKGPFVWHKHEAEDELFLITKGKLLMKLRDKDVSVGEGEFIIIPHGVEHMPVADEETHVLLIEPKSTLNTGNIRNEKTVSQLKKI